MSEDTLDDIDIFADVTPVVFVLSDARGKTAASVVEAAAYPVVKFLSEKIQGSLVHYVIKSLWVVVIFSLFYYITKIFFVAKIKELKYSILLTALFLVIMFFLYDYILTLILSLYERRIKRRRDIKLSK